MIELDLHFTYEQMNMHFQLSVKKANVLQWLAKVAQAKAHYLI